MAKKKEIKSEELNGVSGGVLVNEIAHEYWDNNVTVSKVASDIIGSKKQIIKRHASEWHRKNRGLEGIVENENLIISSLNGKNKALKKNKVAFLADNDDENKFIK